MLTEVLILIVFVAVDSVSVNSNYIVNRLRFTRSS